MPNLNQTVRNFRYFSVLKTTIASQLGIPETPLEWDWDGRNLLTRISDIPEVGVPLPGITRITERWVITPWEDIRLQWFASYPPAIFDNLSIGFDATHVFFFLNREES